MEWINKNWAKIGFIISIGIILVILVADLELTDIERLLWLHFSILLLHQFEEYIYPGGFKKFFNQSVWNKNPITRYPLNDLGILIVNVAVGWTAYFISAIYNTQLLWLAIGLLLITLFNGLLHTFIAIIRKKYNPGFITGLFIFIPFSLYVIFKLLAVAIHSDWVTGVSIFFIGTAMIPISIYLSNQIKGANQDKAVDNKTS